MKILHLTKNLNAGGITTYLLELLPELVKRGHEVYLASAGGEKQVLFEQAGIICLPGPFGTRSELNPRIYTGLPGFLQFVKEKQIDLFHAHTRVTQVFASLLSFLSRRPFVSTIHGFYKKNWSRILVPAFGREAIAISTAVGDALLRDYPALKDRLQVVPNAMDVKKFSEKAQRMDRREICKRYKLDPNVPIIGFVGRLEEVKGGEVLLAAVKDLIKQRPKLQIVFAGDGKERERWENLSRAWLLDRNVFFLGKVEEIQEVYSILEVFVYPVLWEEGFGLSVLEAMAAAKPVVVSQTGALPSIVADGVTGLVVPKNEPGRLASAIEKLLRDKGEARQMGEKGLERAEDYFSIEGAVDVLEKIYREVL